jgi:hypothetical protein
LSATSLSQFRADQVTGKRERKSTVRLEVAAPDNKEEEFVVPKVRPRGRRRCACANRDCAAR